MRRVLLTVLTLAPFVSGVTPGGNTSDSFSQRLPQNKQVIHVLNRLAFGPRPGDEDAVRRIGVAKWIRLQLHPEEIPENPALDQKLKLLDTLRLSTRDLMDNYFTPPQSMMMATQKPPERLEDLLSQEDSQKVRLGTAEERTEVLKSLDPDKQRKVLALLPPNVVKYTPEFREEAEAAQRQHNEERSAEARRLNPQLQDLLNPDQVEVVRSGTREQLAALFVYLDSEKRPLVASLLPPNRAADLPGLRRQGEMQRNPQLLVMEDLREAKVLRAIYSSRQLQEVLVDFWFNHFNVDESKNIPRANNVMQVLTATYERDAIRPHVFGHFKDLLLATARHPAMLYYLDNWESVAPGSFDVGPFAPNRGTVNGVPNSILPGPLARIAHGLNENYGREVMELHTLGVKGGYTQDDVIAVARCFTGWTVRDSHDPEFVFAPFMHDTGEKTLLGHKIPAGGGEQDGLQVIDILAHHPSTARFISRELAQRFVADDPPPSLLDRMAKTFTKTDGDLRAVMEVMFTSPEFMSEGAYDAKVKSPFEMVVSAVRAVGGETTDAYTLVGKISELGEPLYTKLEPKGYSNTGEPWLSATGLMGRMNFSAALANGMIPGVAFDPSRLDAKDPGTMARALLGHDASPETLAAIARSFESTVDTKAIANGDRSTPFVTSLLLGSPDFQRR
jgi:uncharacterized protein (DUF1800 family)